jgi:bifunctional non-homologous end joining protein LigD
MPLEDYERKRDFDETPEPGPAVKSSPGSNLFVIQKHAARRLHYDVRLELDGTLKSWAVPKGPSLDPSEKHLAVHVEDHPLDYASFEGVIPKGQYGGGTVMVWDQGRWFPEGDAARDPGAAYREGKLKFRLEGQKLRGRWMLLRLKPRGGDDKDNWLLFKERDEEAREGDEAAVTTTSPDSAASGRSMDQIAADADRVWSSEGEIGAGDAVGVLQESRDLAAVPGVRKAPVPSLVEPQLATLVSDSPKGDDWLHEIKLDGYRVMCRIEDGTLQLLTRRGADWTSHFPTLLEPVKRVPARTAILDGEVVFVKPDGRTSFLKLASALQSGTDREGGVVYYVFDILHLDGHDLTQTPLCRRKEVLRELLSGFSSNDRVRFVEHLQGHGEEFFRQACDYALEGEIAKRRDAPYRPGRGRDWLKVKCMSRQEFVVGGFTERADGPGGVGALLLGFREERGGPFRYAGRVGTGWDDRAMKELRSRLEELKQGEPAFVDPPSGRAAKGVAWVRPVLVAEVEYLSWNGRGMFRHPSFEGLRLDKPAAEVVAEHAQAPGLPPITPPGEASTSPDDAGSEGSARRGHTSDEAGGDGKEKVVKKARGLEKRVTIGGVSLSNPDRIMYPDLGLTKLDLARYYEDTATWMLPHLSRRPLTIVRCPEGHSNECFFQKHAVDNFPETILRVPIEEGDGANVGVYIAIDSTAGLLSLVQMGVLEFHVWGSHLDTLEHPDQIVFDLDPDPGLPFARVVEAARLLHDLLDGLGLSSYVKTTGGKGLHVVAPLLPTRTWDEVKPFTKGVAESLERFDPEKYIVNMSLKKRVGKIYVDYLRNGRGATYISAFSTRRRPGAAVATPLRWDELGPSMRADRYNVNNIRRRLAGLREDPWKGYEAIRQEITEDMRDAVLEGRITRR